MNFSLVLAIVVPVVQPAKTAPISSPGAISPTQRVNVSLTDEIPTDEFDSCFRLIARGRNAAADEINRVLADLGPVGELSVRLSKGNEITLWSGNVVAFRHTADATEKVRLLVSDGTLTWFVRREIDWKTSEGVETGVKRLVGDAAGAMLRVGLSANVSYDVKRLISWKAVPLEPITVRTAKDVEEKGLFKISFGADAVTAELPLPIYKLRIPYSAAKRGEARLDYDGIKWTLRMGDQRDVDFVHRAVMVADNSIASKYPKMAEPTMPDSRPISGPMKQFWTPHDWNAWVGDCATIYWHGRVHVFYLLDRRHHTSKNGGGGHYFAHISSADLVNWTEHPDPVPPTRHWEFIGTGMPIEVDGKLLLFYGLHTDRYGRGFEKFPIGGTYATSDDGIHFTKSDYIFSDDQNPSPFVREDGKFGIVHAFCGSEAGEWMADTVKGPWKKLHDTIPTGGDCPFHFYWNGWRYVIQGFIGMASSKTGAPGTWEDLVMTGNDIYDGLCVPVVSEYPGNRRIILGWITHPDGWGGWLCLRELIQHPDGKLGTKWLKEIPPPEKPFVFDLAAGEVLKKRFVRTDGDAPDLEFRVDPKADRAQFADVVGGEVPRILTLSERAQSAVGENDYTRYLKRYTDSPDRCKQTAIGHLRGVDKPYRVQLDVHYDPKGETTLFDAEIAGERTLLVIRRGKWSLAR